MWASNCLNGLWKTTFFFLIMCRFFLWHDPYSCYVHKLQHFKLFILLFVWRCSFDILWYVKVTQLLFTIYVGMVKDRIKLFMSWVYRNLDCGFVGFFFFFSFLEKLSFCVCCTGTFLFAKKCELLPILFLILYKMTFTSKIKITIKNKFWRKF